MPRRSRARRRTSAGTTKLRTAGRRAALAQSIRNFRLDQLRQLRERFLPAEIAGLRRNDLGNAFLHDVQFSPARDLLQDRKSTSELQSLAYLVCRLLLEKKKKNN